MLCCFGALVDRIQLVLPKFCAARKTLIRSIRAAAVASSNPLEHAPSCKLRGGMPAQQIESTHAILDTVSLVTFEL